MKPLKKIRFKGFLTTRSRVCPECGGSGYDPFDGGQCFRCGGLGEI